MFFVPLADTRRHQPGVAMKFKRVAIPPPNPSHPREAPEEIPREDPQGRSPEKTQAKLKNKGHPRTFPDIFGHRSDTLRSEKADKRETDLSQYCPEAIASSAHLPALSQTLSIVEGSSSKGEAPPWVT